MPTPTKRHSLHDATRALLHKDTRTLLQIHEGSGLPFYWLRKFSSMEIKEPSVNRTQQLYEFLSGRSLSL